MSASVVPPPPPPEAPPPLPDEPPPPITPSQATDGMQQYVDSQQAHVYHLSAGNAAYPYAQQPMYQYPLQQPYTQAYNPYPPYPSYTAWQAPAMHTSYGAVPSYSPYQSAQQYQAYSPAQPPQQTWDSAAAVTAANASATPNALSSSGMISFSLDGTSKPGAPAPAQASRSPEVPAQRPLVSAPGGADPPQTQGQTTRTLSCLGTVSSIRNHKSFWVSLYVRG